MRKPDGQTVVLGATIGGVCVMIVTIAAMTMLNSNGRANSESRSRELTLRQIPFNGERAYQMLRRLCDIGPRFSGSPGMERQQSMLRDHFTKLGGRVSLQEFPYRHPIDGSRVTMGNMLVEWHPERKERILLCAHYDTRPFPDADPNPARRRGTFIGANDGASGVAVLAEMAHHMPALKGRYGVDFVLFDGEELVYDSDRDPFFIGSEHFAKAYRQDPPSHRYRWGVLLDMVGDANLQIYQEKYSLRWPDTRPLVKEIWEVARRLGVREFRPRARYEIRDDHIALRNIAGIPTCDIIDFDYPAPGRTSYWHTEADTADKCSALSLAKVGWVVHEWLKQQQSSKP